ncbi:MAG: exodeoxyribonuclease VII small subunit [Woeseiaceae bacterium]
MAKAKKSSVDLEKSLAELETLVDELETGDLPLEAAMSKFERGVSLTKDCQKALTDVEQRVAVLLQDAGLADEPKPLQD